MSEEIATRLEVSSEKPNESYAKPNDSITNPNEYQSLYEQFGVEKNSRSDSALSKIWEYAKEKSANKDKESILWEVIRLNHKLGSPNIGERPYAKVEAYVSAYFQQKQAEQRMRELDGQT